MNEPLEQPNSVEHTTPTKNDSPGKSSTLSMGKLDLGKVESQKRLDEESVENQNEANKESTKPLVSDRELEEIYNKNEE